MAALPNIKLLRLLRSSVSGLKHFRFKYLHSSRLCQCGTGRVPWSSVNTCAKFALAYASEELPPPLTLAIEAGQKKSAENVLDTDDNAFQAALETALFNVSHVLLTRLADRLGSGRRNKYSYLRLHFNH